MSFTSSLGWQLWGRKYIHVLSAHKNDDLIVLNILQKVLLNDIVL